MDMVSREKSAKGNTTLGDRNFRDEMKLLADKASTPDERITLPVIASYGVERLAKKIPKGHFPQDRFRAYDRALDPRSDLKRLSQYILFLESEAFNYFQTEGRRGGSAVKQLESIRHACNVVIQEITGWGDMEWNGLLGDLTMSHSQFGTLPMSHLATGTKIAAGVALDIASRAARANPHLGGESLLQETPGIVLIDEVDMHLHPKWQKRIVGQLREAFPRIQFILTSHSPQVIGSVPTAGIRVLQNNHVYTPEFGEGLRPEIVLQQLQGVDPVPITSNRALIAKYLALVETGEGTSADASQLRQQIEDELGGAARNEEIAHADAVLAFESINWEA
ncbi:AAA family ATPase [Corynebacterium cystitidis]|uniref:AAA family ATPase n=2 Tax=Corynebacterium cystitidis TaxID=35757 RepID=UPI00211E9B1C|nr:AAA family ATPase [Corynebacterium cystitidis]